MKEMTLKSLYGPDDGLLWAKMLLNLDFFFSKYNENILEES